MEQKKLQPLVSVIVPVYNVEKYLPCCLDSIIGQTYQNLEIILVNDGSTDKSGEICREYAQGDPRIRVFTQENKGLSAARNVGLDNMEGEYVTFVDSDDYIAPHMVETLLSELLKYNVLITVCSYLEVKDGDNHTRWDMMASKKDGCRRMTRDEIFDTVGTSDNVAFVVAYGKVYEKRIFEKLRYPVGRKHEDEFVFHDIYAQVDAVCYVNLKLYAYRRSLNSITRVNGVGRVYAKDIIDMQLRRLAFFEMYGVKKYCFCTERMLVSDLALYWINDAPSKEKAKQCIKETEAKVYEITGRKLFSCRWIIFKISPRLYWFLRKYCRRVRNLVRSLRGKEFTR